MPEITQKVKACKSCPFVADGDRSLCFDPNELRRTVVNHLDMGLVHPCHSDKNTLCAGYLSFAEQRLKGGAEALQMVQIAHRLGLLDFNKIPILNVFPSIAAMLRDHTRRSGLTLKRAKKIKKRLAS